jgi:hypothetical protein
MLVILVGLCRGFIPQVGDVTHFHAAIELAPNDFLKVDDGQRE